MRLALQIPFDVCLTSVCGGFDVCLAPFFSPFDVCFAPVCGPRIPQPLAAQGIITALSREKDAFAVYAAFSAARGPNPGT